MKGWSLNLWSAGVAKASPCMAPNQRYGTCSGICAMRALSLVLESNVAPFMRSKNVSPSTLPRSGASPSQP
jgi:hypothetical protein